MSRLKHKETSLDKKPHTVTLPKGTKSHRELIPIHFQKYTSLVVIPDQQATASAPTGSPHMPKREAFYFLFFKEYKGKRLCLLTVAGPIP
jgi:hypothetical protein